jgi:WD40 repeat protein/tRNA A-37 threonylcarbamoyl transferase component Bud32
MADWGCCSEADLRALLAGELPDRIAESITRHLENCPGCESTASRLDMQADHFLKRLRRAVHDRVGDASKAQESSEVRTTPASDAPQMAPDATIEGAPVSGSERSVGDSIPRTPPGYTIVKELGRGGMSVVYQARQKRPDRTVALKMLLYGAYASTEKRIRLLAEAEAVARLQHPGIVPVYEVAEHEGVPFLVLEYVPGGNLAQKINGRPLPARQAAEIVVVLARAIAHAHQEGIIHRDLKPANVLLTTGGQPRISDFGLAKQEQAELTASGDVLGTPSYMAPEQARGSVRLVGPATDIYALGAILYELLTGRPPFLAATVLETLEQVCAREPISPRRLNPKIPRDIDTICLKCLEKDRARRYASAQELAEDLKRFVDGRPVVARPVSAFNKAFRWCQRNPGWTAMAATLTGLLVFIVIGTSMSAAYLRMALTQSQQSLWEAYLEEARASRMSKRSGQRVRSLDAIRRALALPVPPGHALQELRTEAIASMALSDIRVSREWPGLANDTNDIDFSDDFQFYARADKEGGASVRRVADDVEVARLPGFGTKGYFSPHLSPDGTHLVVRNSGSGQGRVWRLRDAAPELRWELPEGALRSASFSLDGHLLAQIDFEGRLEFFDLLSGKRTSATSAGRVRTIAFHPNNKQFLTVTRIGDQDWCCLCELPHNGVTAKFAPGVTIRGCRWHPDGRTLAIMTSDNRVVFWDVTTGKTDRILSHPAPVIVRATFNHTGDLLVTSSDRLRCWNPRTCQQVFEMPFRPACLRFSPDDRLLACDLVMEGGLVRLHEVAVGREYISLRRGSLFGSPAVSPNGAFLVASTEDGVRLWDLTTGQELALFPGTQGTSGVLFAADGGALFTHGPQGLWCWPIHEEGEARLQIGPPQMRSLNTQGGGLSQSNDGRVLACCPGRIANDGTGQRSLRIFQSDVESCSVSPDGRYVAFGSYSGIGQPDFAVYEAASGNRVFTGPVGIEGSDVAFSREGRWLAATSGGTRLWSAESWKPHRFVGGSKPAFSPDECTLAVETGSGSIRLVDVATGQDLARFEDPEQIISESLTFSPDGTRLIATSSRALSIHVWDLRRIRLQLAEMGLDWEAPPFPAAGPSNVSSLPTVVVDPSGFAFPASTEAAAWSLAISLLPLNPEAHYRRALAHVALSNDRPERHRDAAVADFRRAVRLHPDFLSLVNRTPARTTDLNGLAWWCVSEVSDLVDAGVVLAKQAVTQDETDFNLLNTLGVALYRTGRYQDAVVTLEKSLGKGDPGMAAYDLYFLAMCHFRLGDKTKATDCMKRAIASHERNASQLGATVLQELSRFRAEAESCLRKSAPSTSSRAEPGNPALLSAPAAR